MTIVQKISPNFTRGRGGYRPEVIVVHIMAGSLSGTDRWFADPQSQVSSHYGIGLTGEVHQYVSENDTAWHAGRVNNPTFRLYKPSVNPNLYTIGIENEGQDLAIAPEAQLNSLVELIQAVAIRWGIPIDREHIIGHYEIDSVRRPNCPASSKGIIDSVVSRAKPLSPALKDEILKKMDELRGLVEKL
jgi:N-acetylmuramoyl-L-alanine amidase